MASQNTVIIIPGLGDNTRVLEIMTLHWKKHGLMPYVHSVGWRNNKDSFGIKLQELVSLIDHFLKRKDTVSLVGTSAGGSAALNAFFKRKRVIHRVVSICGRSRLGPTAGFRSFANMTKTSPAFAESVRMCDKREKSLTEADKKKIMTVRAQIGDELVPPETATISGALNIQVPMVEHVLSIGSALTLFSKPIIDFLK
ncbi:hypothetical protein COU88_05240 [Candidatus Roizmanbacteria bacterium CG10_big_fil_rev_8_21_14_0_10_39_6]|uniref:AB hydrolase-1 domain-containing protein n=1 Tax=Candidatus Roizmanbacteria bacterium CG10_big_fil_rev_8_21_14_0_10_39_6 TaxID=1974853 RepID=A0A2M8KR62_9BACT|nr:MAG: hypothetical protein COU88_05240 [Candidatus Roizmanbacteria bacterium CG10_big_fil_rev_8_21_14_0_10_39_6]